MSDTRDQMPSCTCGVVAWEALGKRVVHRRGLLKGWNWTQSYRCGDCGRVVSAGWGGRPSLLEQRQTRTRVLRRSSGHSDTDARQ